MSSGVLSVSRQLLRAGAMVSGQGQPFHTSSILLRRKDRRSIVGNLPPEDEGIPGERSVTIGQDVIPQFPNLDTYVSTFHGLLYTDINVLHIRCTPNNTIITAEDVKTTKPITNLTCGMEGFKNCKKGTNVAGQAVGLSMGKRMIARGLNVFRIKLNGLGPGRAASIKGLEMAGIKIVSITDVTPTCQAGHWPRKARRV